MYESQNPINSKKGRRLRKHPQQPQRNNPEKDFVFRKMPEKDFAIASIVANISGLTRQIRRAEPGGKYETIKPHKRPHTRPSSYVFAETGEYIRRFALRESERNHTGVRNGTST